MRLARLLLAAAMLVAQGCAGGHSGAGSPLPVPHPTVELPAVDDPPVVQVAYLSPPPGEPQVDRLLASPLLRDPEFQEAVEGWVDYWQNAATPWFPDFVRRMGSFERTVDAALAERALPPSLRFLPLIESGYNPGARSGASAVGLWQFMAGTAREHGMEVGAFVDERRDPFKSTDAAVRYLESLHDDFGSWFLTLAAYNGGPNRARRILREQAPLAEPSDSLFWALRHHWPKETQEFVPKLVGAIRVAQNPMRYGYPAIQLDPPFDFDEVVIADAATFDVLARAADVEESEIQRLNPELYRGFTPPQSEVVLRVPRGRADQFMANYALVPAGERMTVVQHAVQSGETLSHVARRYGVSVADLQAANPGVRARYLRIGMTLTVPIALSRRGTG